MKNYLLLAILFLPAVVLGQAEYQKVRELFEKPNADVKIVTFKGLLNEVHPITIHIGHKNNEAHGYYRLMSSGEEIWLHGEYINQSFTVSEHNNARSLGTIHFDDQLETKGNWSSNTYDNILPIELRKVRFGEFITPESKKRVICYALDKRKLSANIILEPLYNDTYLLHSTINKKYQVQEVNCSNQKCEKIIINISNQKINLSLQGKELFHVDEKNKKEQFKVLQEGTFKTFAYATSDALFDVSYLKTPHNIYNQWIKKLIKNYKEEKILEIENIKKEESSSHHFSLQWTGWQEIDYWTERVISGRMVFFESWTKETYTIPIIYDLETNASLDLQSEFGKNNKEIIRELTRLNTLDYNPDIQSNSRDHTEFKVMSIVKNGILLSSLFDPVNGYIKRVIPYKSFKGKLRKNSPIHQLLKS